MSLLSYTELVELVESGVIDAPLENINGASIDLTLDKHVRYEAEPFAPVDLSKKENINTEELLIDAFDGYVLSPGEFVLASTREIFNLPADIAAEYKLKSSMARNGLEHLNAGFCDPYWHNSKLTLELKNITEEHDLLLREGMKIGQIVFFRTKPVPKEHGYAAKGQYNNQKKVQESKGIR